MVENAKRAKSGDGKPRIPPFVEVLAGALIVFLGLIANGRPIVAGDTRSTEHVAASMVTEGDFDLDEYPEVKEPFAITIGSHRVSIYPVLSAVLAAPVFLAAKPFFVFDEEGCALAGKVAAALLSSLAAAVFFIVIARLHGRCSAWLAMLMLAWGTSVCSTSQALWQHPAAVLFISVTLLCLVLAERGEVWAGRAGLPLALVLAARHADVAIVAVLFVRIALRWPRRIPALIGYGLPVAVLQILYQTAMFGSPIRHGFSDKVGWFSAPWGVGHLGLLFSPARGLLIFTPVVVVAFIGIARAWRGERRWLAITAAMAALAHWFLLGRWEAWHGGVCWGPRMMTDVMPLLLLFLPLGFALLPRLGALLAVASLAAQFLGAFAYNDYRWERLYQWTGTPFNEALWTWRHNPLLFHVRERVLVFALPMIHERRVVIHQYPIVWMGRSGSQLSFSGNRIVITGNEARLGDVHVVRRAWIDDDHLALRGRWSGLFLRVLPAGRQNCNELRIAGSGEGRLYLGIRRFLGETRYVFLDISGDFIWRQRYESIASPGPDLLITVGKPRSIVDIKSVSLGPAAGEERD